MRPIFCARQSHGKMTTKPEFQYIGSMVWGCYKAVKGIHEFVACLGKTLNSDKNDGKTTGLQQPCTAVQWHKSTRIQVLLSIFCGSDESKKLDEFLAALCHNYP